MADDQHGTSVADHERQLLADATAKGGWAKYRTYIRLSGPGWLQSAITLGGGSLANGLYLGIFAGFSLLWVQPVAMALGIVMLSAIAYVTTSTGERPFQAINRHVNPVLGWSWLLASLLANMVWALPQYALASGVLRQNLLPGLVGPDGALGDRGGQIAIVAVILIVSTLITWAYGGKGWGIRLYEYLLKAMVAMIVLCFFGVLLAIRSELDWGAVFRGFIPDVRTLFHPSPEFNDLLAAVPQQYHDFWVDRILSEQRSVLIGATATAVGINMTFLFPYSMLAKGWTKEYRGLAKFDLATGMLIPFMLATSCVVIAAANQFHPKPGQVTLAEGQGLSPTQIESLEADRQTYLDKQAAAADDTPETGAAVIPAQPPNDAEQLLAIHLTRRDAFDLATSLAPLTGSTVANYVFGLGVLGMALSTITILMLISGFCVCEALGLPPTGWPHRLGCLAAATGVLGPFLWQGEARFWLAVPTSVFGMMLLPIAYWTFFLLMNQRSLLGDEMPTGGRRVVWNTLMILAASVATFLCLWAISISPLGPDGPYPYGFYIFGGLIALAVVVHFLRPREKN